MLARGGEAFVMEGKAPNTTMKTVFMKLAAWMRDIYKGVSNYKFPELTPEMREVYADMVGRLDERLGVTEKPPVIDGETAPGVAENIVCPSIVTLV